MGMLLLLLEVPTESSEGINFPVTEKIHSSAHMLALPGSSRGGWPLREKDTRRVSAPFSPPSAFIFPSATPEFSRVLCCFQTSLGVRRTRVGQERQGLPNSHGVHRSAAWDVVADTHYLPCVLPILRGCACTLSH